MSSYQFVNSLTSCYGQQRGQDSSSQDYYTPQVQTYGGCYSGPGSPVQQQYGPYPQHTVPHLQNGGGEHHFNSCSQRLTHPNPSQSPRTPTPSVTPVPSCKYAEPSAASPQDLSTSGGSHPPPAVSPESRTSPVSPRQGSQPATSGQHHSSPSHGQQPQIPASGNQQNQQSSPQQPQTQTQQPQQSQEPISPQQPGQQQKPNFTNNPPQIYPWMRKVHVGQSK